MRYVGKKELNRRNHESTINTKTGEDVTRDYLALLEGKMTKQEFEKKYNLKS